MVKFYHVKTEWGDKFLLLDLFPREKMALFQFFFQYYTPPEEREKAMYVAIRGGEFLYTFSLTIKVWQWEFSFEVWATAWGVDL